MSFIAVEQRRSRQRDCEADLMLMRAEEEGNSRIR